MGRQMPAHRAGRALHWTRVMLFLVYAPEVVRRIVCTTGAMESLHMRLREIVKNRDHFASDGAATSLHCRLLRRNSVMSQDASGRAVEMAILLRLN